jgi:hypothetical protein
MEWRRARTMSRDAAQHNTAFASETPSLFRGTGGAEGAEGFIAKKETRHARRGARVPTADGTRDNGGDLYLFS